MNPTMLALLALAGGASLLLLTKREPEGKRINLAGRQYRIHQGEGYLKIVREFEGKDAISVTATGTPGHQVYEIWRSPELGADVLLRLGCESAMDIRDRWSELGLPRQAGLDLPPNCAGINVAGSPPFLFVREGE